jgi:hypothetical protein
VIDCNIDSALTKLLGVTLNSSAVSDNIENSAFRGGEDFQG